MTRFAGSDHRLYLKVEGFTVQGFIKVGTKDLFYREASGKCREISPLCVLDFYVHESVQRQGLGKQLFMKMLTSENVLPAKLAYDRPSPKLTKFLYKHFGLASFVPQNNNFVIFDEYFKVDLSNRARQSPEPSQERRPAAVQNSGSVRHETRRAFQASARRIARSPGVEGIYRPQQEEHEPYGTFKIRAWRGVQQVSEQREHFASVPGPVQRRVPQSRHEGGLQSEVRETDRRA